jgi:NAD(P)-dependent dehydrogenase (short-subunit alcohol dehydrogenase family)
MLESGDDRFIADRYLSIPADQKDSLKIMNGKVVIITGAFGTLGRVVASKFSRLGARIVLIDKAPNPPADLGNIAAGDCECISNVDIADPTVASQTIERIRSTMTSVDALVNIAGGFRWELVADGQSRTWDDLYRMNVQTTVNMCRAVLPILTRQGRGRIVNIGASAALKAAKGMAPYAAAKAAVHRLTESLAEELKGQATVNAVLPTIIDTPQNRREMPDADFTTWVRPDELASLIAFLVSEDGGAITGALIPVNGRM